jgi:hypothetical protein
MKHNLIKTENYLLVVDDSEIVEADWAIHNYKDYRERFKEEPIKANKNNVLSIQEHWDKIIAHLPLNNASYLDSVPLLPSLSQEDDIGQLADEIYPQPIPYELGLSVGADLKKIGFKVGYNKAREKYKYTEENVTQAYLFGKSMMSPNNFKKYIQSLQQPKYPVAFECEMEPKFKHIGSTKEVKGSGDRIKNKYAGNPKTFINSEGRTEWVGKYIYE